MALNPPSGIVQWFNTPIGERGWNTFRAQLTGKDYPGTSRKTSYVKLSDKEAEEVIENIKKDSEGIPLFDEANAPDKAEEYQRWLVARYLTKAREEGFENRQKEGTKELEEELGPEGLDELLGLIREEAKVAVAAGGGGGGTTSSGSPPPPPTSSALAVVPKKPEDLVEEDIDSQILSILGLEDVFDLTYEEYETLLREAAAKGRMSGTQMSTESIELVTEEFKRVKGKTGKFKVKPKKVDINKVMNRAAPSPQKVQLDPQKLLPSADIVEEKTAEEVEDFKEAIVDELDTIGNKLDDLLKSIREEDKQDAKKKETKRRADEKEKKKKREAKLESKSAVSNIFEKVAKPFVSFFDRIKQFFLSILIGSAINFLLNVIKNPSIILNPLRNLVNGIVNFLNGIINWIWNAVITPINFVINSINTGIQGAINVINGALRLLGQPQISAQLIDPLPTQSPVQIPTWNAPVQQQAGGGQVVNSYIQQQAGGGQVVNVGDLTFNKGGSITNNSGITITGLGKDTRLIAAEPGEVMMSNPAGDFWGRDNLLAMNATGGGTNKPKFGQMGISAMQGGGVVGMQSRLPPLPPTNTLPGKQHYGASRDGGSRQHAGVDFDISGNEKFYSRIGGQVVGAPFRYGDDGWAIDIYNKNLNVFERIAEAAQVLVSPGQMISPGQAVVRGESNTGVIHYEIRRKIMGGFENTLDPIAFLGNPIQQAQIAGGSFDMNIPSAPAAPSVAPMYIGGGMMPSQQSSPAVSSASGNQSEVPSFSSEDPNNMTSIVVKSIYNVVG